MYFHFIYVYISGSESFIVLFQQTQSKNDVNHTLCLFQTEVNRIFLDEWNQVWKLNVYYNELRAAVQQN